MAFVAPPNGNALLPPKGIVKRWEISDPVNPLKRWNVLIIHRGNGNLNTLALEAGGPDEVHLAQSSFLNSSLSNFRNFRLNLAKRIDLFYQNYRPDLGLLREIIFKPLNSITQVEPERTVQHHLITRGERVYDQLSFNGQLDPKISELQFGNDLRRAADKIQALYDHRYQLAFVDGGLRLFQPEVTWREQDGHVTTGMMLGDKIYAAFYPPHQRTFTLKQVHLDHSERFSPAEKRALFTLQHVNVQNQTFEKRMLSSRLDPTKKLSWDTWLITMIEEGSSSDHWLINRCPPVGHSALLLERIETSVNSQNLYEPKYQMDKLHAVAGTRVHGNAGFLVPLPQENITQPEFRRKGETYPVHRKDAEALIAEVAREKLNPTVRFDNLHANCAFFTKKSLTRLGIQPRLSRMESRTLTNCVISGFLQGDDFDGSAYHHISNETLLAPDTFTEPVRPRSVVGQIVNRVALSAGFSISSVVGSRRHNTDFVTSLLRPHRMSIQMIRDFLKPLNQ